MNARRAPQPHDLGLVVGLVVVRRVHREDAVVLPYDDAVRQFLRVRRLLLRIFKVELTWKCACYMFVLTSEVGWLLHVTTEVILSRFSMTVS